MNYQSLLFSNYKIMQNINQKAELCLNHLYKRVKLSKKYFN